MELLKSYSAPVKGLGGVPTEIVPDQSSPLSSVSDSEPVARLEPLGMLDANGCVAPVFFSKLSKPLWSFLKSHCQLVASYIAGGVGTNAKALAFWLFSTFMLAVPSVLRTVKRLVKGMTFPERAAVSSNGLAVTRNGRVERMNAKEKCMASKKSEGSISKLTAFCSIDVCFLYCDLCQYYRHSSQMQT